MVKVLFVCLGNICRSPMAEAVLHHMIREAGLDDKIQVDSAGTEVWDPGEAAHPGTMQVLKAHHVPYVGRARQFDLSDLDTFDYILAMDRENLTQIMRLVNRGERSSHDKLNRFYDAPDRPEIALFLSYANRAGLVERTEVSDPYYDGRFNNTYELVMAGCTALLAHLRKVHRL
ncbi:MAG: low molecular weight phosphotyrosine protein phosphatase [Anaerolineae bacterium]|nr:low molecular weight phosphotyrosine protein phosphatase [Anaerolineae bacterium]